GGWCALFAGLLTALSPGMALFSNLLLAHHATLVGLGFFVLGFLRMVRGDSTFWGIVAGSGLTFAMLCRPLTAAGIAWPFGVWWLAWIFRKVPVASSAAPVRRLTLALALGAPLMIGLAVLFLYNQAITGNGWLTPYSLYTETYTPRHVYGFQNV